MVERLPAHFRLENGSKYGLSIGLGENTHFGRGARLNFMANGLID